MTIDLYYVTPALCTLVAAEAWIFKRSGKRYSLNIALSNMSCGLLSLCTSVFSTIVFAVLYREVETRYGIFQTLGWQWWSVLLAFVLADLCYYAYHRASHRIAILWAAHIVHHESDEYNLTVSLRQGSVALFTSIPFYLAPALLGVPMEVFVAANGVYQLYQFFVHNAVVQDVGWLEHVLATPRLHRLHHARNEPYLDCNYSGFLILWDKLFGSYKAPSVEPLFGVVEPLSSWSPLWANAGYFAKLIEQARTRRGWDRLWTFFAAPEWRPSREAVRVQQPYVAYDACPSLGLRRIAVTLFGIAVVLAVSLMTLPLAAGSPLQLGLIASAAGLAWISTRMFDGVLPQKSDRLSGSNPGRSYDPDQSPALHRQSWRRSGRQVDELGG